MVWIVMFEEGIFWKDSYEILGYTTNNIADYIIFLSELCLFFFWF